MKNKLAQLFTVINKIDPQVIKLTYFALMIGVGILLRAPYDGGTGPV